MNNSISLIGMAGAGKSSIGKKLAKHLKFNFVDSDLLIEKKRGRFKFLPTSFFFNIYPKISLRTLKLYSPTSGFAWVGSPLLNF